MKKPIFTGAGVAIITPFTSDGKVNYPALKEILEYQISNSTDCIVICGTTGESATLSHEEHTEVIKYAVDVVAGRIPVVAGTGSNDTAYALNLSNEAEKAGVDGLLMVTPYYNKASQEGLIKHFTYVADRVSTPIILYNVPSRTGCEIKPETYAELSKHKNIYAAKEATGNLSSIAKTISLCSDDFAVYSGNDDQITPIMSLSARALSRFFQMLCRRRLMILPLPHLTVTLKRVPSFSLSISSFATLCLWMLTPSPSKLQCV